MLYKFIFGYTNMKNISKIDGIMNNFNKTKETASEQTKNEIKMKLWPYLDNPYYVIENKAK